METWTQVPVGDVAWGPREQDSHALTLLTSVLGSLCTPHTPPQPCTVRGPLTLPCCCCYYCSLTKSCVTLETPWTAVQQTPLSFTVSWSSLKLRSVESVMHPAVSSSVAHFSSCRQSSPASGPFPVSQLLASGGQSVGASASASVLPMNIQSWTPLGWTDTAVQGTLRSLLQHHSFKAPVLRCSAFFMVQLAHPYMTTGKTTALTRSTFVGKVMSLLFNMLSRFVTAFLIRSKCLNSMTAALPRTNCYSL